MFLCHCFWTQTTVLEQQQQQEQQKQETVLEQQQQQQQQVVPEDGGNDARNSEVTSGNEKDVETKSKLNKMKRPLM